MKTRWILLLVTLFSVISVSAQENANTRQGRKMFDEVYEKVFGPQGCTLYYKANVARIYKTEGSIWYKGKKSHYVGKTGQAWNDGTTAYVVKNDKKRVEIYDATSSKQSKFGDDFKFEAENYTYHIAADPKGYLITLNLKKGKKGMKEIKALLDKKTHNPLSLRIKVAFIWANVDISNFKSGNINDNVFVFPQEQFKGYQFEDKREKK